MPGSLLGLWASLFAAAVATAALMVAALFVWDYLYLSGGRW